MHDIKFKKLVFSNILSYGDNENEVIFNDGLIWIKGPNGVGKSSILEALTFAFFGKPYRAINKSELRNSANKSKLYVMIDFDRIDSESTVSYQITREMGMSGSGTFKISKDGDVEKKGAGITQKKLEDEILGFNQIIWENVLSLNTIQTTPFIDMDAGEKRKLLESILTLQLDKMKDLNKKTLKESNVKFNSATYDVVKYETDIADLIALVAQMEQEQADDIEIMESDIATTRLNIELKEREKAILAVEINNIIELGKNKKTEIDAFANVDAELFRYSNYEMILNDIVRIDDEYTEVNNRLLLANKKNTDCKVELELLPAPSDYLEASEQNVKMHTLQLARLENDLTNYNIKLNSIKVEGESLVAGIACPTCGKDSCEADFKDRKESLRLEWKSVNAEMKLCVSAIEDKKNTLTLVNDEYSTMKSEADVYVAKAHELSSAYNEVTSVQNELNKVSARLVAKKAQIDDGIDSEVVKLKKIELLAQKELCVSMNAELSVLRESVARKQQEAKGITAMVQQYHDDIAISEAKIILKKESNSENAIATAKLRLTGANNDFERAKDRVKKYSDEISVATYIEKMYDDSGIKKIILGIFVPNLNSAIAHNFSLFNLPFTLEFDDSMSHKFSGRYGSAQVYNGLSQGQKRKLNFAIAMAFRDFVTSIADFRVNALFLDEVLDISTDEEAFVSMTELLRNKVPEVGGIYMMTHRGELISDMFDQFIEVEHDGLYSSLSMKNIVRSSNY